MSLIAIAFFVATVAATLVITLWASRRAKSRADLYAAGGKLSGPQNGLAIAGDFMSATTFLGMTGMYFDAGIDQTAIYYLTPLVGLCLMMLLLAGPLRRAGKFTLGDVMATRLKSPGMRVFAGVSTIVISLLYLIGQMVGAGTLIGALFGIPFGWAVIIVGLLMTTYVAAGGMLAATWVQIIKAGMLVVLVVTLAVLCLVATGGPSALYAKAAAVHQAGRGLFTPGISKTDLFSSISLGFGMSVGMLGLPHLLIRLFTVPDVREAKRSVVAATSIIGVVFALLFFVVNPAAVSLLKLNPAYSSAAGAAIGGPNMVSIHLSEVLGGEVLMGVTSAITFATILAVVAGLVMASASAASHDLFTVMRKGAARDEKQELMVFRLAAAGVAVVAIGLAFLFQHENVAFATALAFTVAAGANFPILLLVLYWRRLTVPGALTGGLVGLVGSVGLIAVGPSVWVRLLHNPAPLFPSDYPALLTCPLALITAVVVSLATAPRSQSTTKSASAT